MQGLSRMRWAVIEVRFSVPASPFLAAVTPPAESRVADTSMKFRVCTITPMHASAISVKLKMKPVVAMRRQQTMVLSGKFR